MNDLNTNGMVNPNNNIVRNWLIGIGIALIVIVAITFAIHRKDTVSPVVGDDMGTTTTGATMTGTTSASMATDTTMTGSARPMTPATGELITIDNQPAGDSVAIASVTLTDKSWIAIKNEQGTILGAALFQASDTKGTISLIEGTTPGQTYEAVIYVDSTGKSFDYKQDSLVVGADDAPVSATFVAQ